MPLNPLQVNHLSALGIIRFVLAPLLGDDFLLAAVLHRPLGVATKIFIQGDRFSMLSEEEFRRRCENVFAWVIWVGCIYGLIYTAFQTQDFIAAATRAPGVVVALNAGGSHPEIEYTNNRGEKISYPQGGLISGYRVGDRVTVLYLADARVADACIDRFGALWDFPLFFVWMLILIPVIQLLRFLERRSKQKPQNKPEKWKITE